MSRGKARLKCLQELCPGSAPLLLAHAGDPALLEPCDPVPGPVEHSPSRARAHQHMRSRPDPAGEPTSCRNPSRVRDGPAPAQVGPAVSSTLIGTSPPEGVDDPARHLGAISPRGRCGRVSCRSRRGRLACVQRGPGGVRSARLGPGLAFVTFLDPSSLRATSAARNCMPSCSTLPAAIK